MFKSILGRLFWTYAIILMLVFTETKKYLDNAKKKF